MEKKFRMVSKEEKEKAIKELEELNKEQKKTLNNIIIEMGLSPIKFEK